MPRTNILHVDRRTRSYRDGSVRKSDSAQIEDEYSTTCFRLSLTSRGAVISVVQIQECTASVAPIHAHAKLILPPHAAIGKACGKPDGDLAGTLGPHPARRVRGETHAPGSTDGRGFESKLDDHSRMRSRRARRPCPAAPFDKGGLQSAGFEPSGSGVRNGDGSVVRNLSLRRDLRAVSWSQHSPPAQSSSSPPLRDARARRRHPVRAESVLGRPRP